MANQDIRSIADLARRSNVNENTLQNFFKKERKESLYADVLWMVAQAFECSMEELVTGEEPKTKNEYSHPAIGEVVQALEKLSPDDLTETKGAIAMFIQTQFIKPVGTEASQREPASESKAVGSPP